MKTSESRPQYRVTESATTSTMKSSPASKTGFPSLTDMAQELIPANAKPGNSTSREGSRMENSEEHWENA
jgi:hypothetical protein